MQKPRLSNWEAILRYAALNASSLEDARLVSCNDASWGPRIDAVHIDDLSQEERCSLAEHISVCPACAARLRLRVKVEMYARKLPYYELLKETSEGKQSLKERSDYGSCKHPRRLAERKPDHTFQRIVKLWKKLGSEKRMTKRAVLLAFIVAASGLAVLCVVVLWKSESSLFSKGSIVVLIGVVLGAIALFKPEERQKAQSKHAGWTRSNEDA